MYSFFYVRDSFNLLFIQPNKAYVDKHGGETKKESMTWPFNSSSRNPKSEGQYASLIKIGVVLSMIVAEMSHRSLIH